MTTVPVRATEHLRLHNTAHVLRVLRSDGPTTRTELADRTGLAKATVGAIVAGLEAQGAVTEDAAESTGRGRPGRPISLTPSAVGLGFEVNVDYVAAVAIDLAGRVCWQETQSVTAQPPGPHAVVDLARDALTALTAAGHRVVGATVAVPGLVASDHTTVVWAPNLRWSDHDLGAELRSVLGVDVPISVDNDANCAAQAEASHGAGRDHAHFVYVTGTVGIGAGIIHDHQLLRGGGGFAGEVGHLPVGNPTAVCGCGRRGCWEASVGLRAMLSAVGVPDQATPLASAEKVALRATDDAMTQAVLTQIGQHVGLGLAAISSVLDPDTFVLGGYFVPLGEYLVPAAAEVLISRLPSAEHHPPKIVLSELGIQAAALGAAENALSAIYAGERALS